MPDRNDNFLGQVDTVLRDAMREAGVSTRIQNRIVNRVVEAIYMRHAGLAVYVGLRGPQLDALVMDAFTGDNIPELVRRFRISRRAVERIIQKQRDHRNAGAKI